MVEVATPSKVCFPLVYVFFEVMLMSGIDGIRSCLEDYILLFLFDVCMYVYSDLSGCRVNVSVNYIEKPESWPVKKHV